MMWDDTIAAIATPLGEGGLAIIRLSGPQSLEVVDRCFIPAGSAAPKPSQAASHTLHYGQIVTQERPVDEVMLGIMRAPRSFTREDVVEIICHGGLLSAKLVLDAVLASGARLAMPGEFTRRAFLNGRIDLAQAEAVADLIHARTELALAAAHEQLAGHLSLRINRLRDELMSVLAHIEAHIDFPDENIAPETREQLLGRLQQAVDSMTELLRTAHEGQILRRGLRAAIVVRPNTGKSSLLNRLLGHERAIVSPVPGTTRDTIEETANIRGIPVVFIDTAGLRTAQDPLEREGIRRSHESLSRAELVLHVLDASEPFMAEDAEYLAALTRKKRILVRNKIDLPARLELSRDQSIPVVEVSCRTGQGLEELKEAIVGAVWTGAARPEMMHVLINSRHQQALAQALTAVRQTAETLRAEGSFELVALDLQIAVRAVGEIVGKTATEDLLDSIFSQFCLGK
jgi:tRNA modification GTPase